jgi:plasmid stability protein
MSSNARQYTIRNVPPEVDRVLRQRAREGGKSFNQVALEALVAGTGQSLVPKRDLSDVVGSLTKNEAAHLEQEIRRQHQIDPDLWR